MKEYAIRLREGQDLKQAVIDFAKKENIRCGVVVSSVGCLKNYRLRNAGATAIKEKVDHFEIISLNGTIASGKVHLHMSVSDKDMHVYGGHLVDGNIVNTTVELVILELEEYIAKREYDSSTQYDEIVFERKNK